MKKICDFVINKHIYSIYDVDNKLVDEKNKIKEMYLYNYIGFVELNTSNKKV